MIKAFLKLYETIVLDFFKSNFNNKQYIHIYIYIYIQGSQRFSTSILSGFFEDEFFGSLSV